MMNNQTIFITYNSNAATDQTLALRLHAIGAVNGFRMLLPDRSNSKTVLDSETMARINIADYFILFSSVNLTKIVQAEIAYAYKQWHDKSKIIVVYDKAVGGKNLINTEQCTEILIDTQSQPLNTIVAKIMGVVYNGQHQMLQKLERENREKDGLITFLGIGAGLLLLHALTAKES
jgi:hypothetical protein